MKLNVLILAIISTLFWFSSCGNIESEKNGVVIVDTSVVDTSVATPQQKQRSS